MPSATRLDVLLDNVTLTHADKIAVIDPQRGSVSYRQLRGAASAIAGQLRATGVKAGDRVGICAPKSVAVVAAVFGTLETDAAYVPVDSIAPAARSALILDDCDITALVVHRPLLQRLQDELNEIRLEVVAEIAVEGTASQDLVLARTVRARQTSDAPAGLAYILYTSGTTGRPKGVMHSHATALSFIDWCSTEFAPRAGDVFASHAPFHFDLSIFDLYVSIKHGAALVLIGEECAKQPLQLAALIAEQRITVWYSTPSILRLLVEFGKMTGLDHSALRLVLFAGEVFPIKHQRALRSLWPQPVYYNLYGPTETNVCTYERVDSRPAEDVVRPPSIGRVCSGDRLRVIDGEGCDTPPGEEGELIVSGGSVMLGYWGAPDDNAGAFRTDTDGVAWYKTGDMVVDDGGGRYLFHGRRDRMVKRRGYRVELGEIEAALYRHANVTEAAVVAIPDVDSGVIIKVFMNWTGAKKPSLVELKRFAAQNLPAYMIPDRFEVLAALPKTSTDKIDYQRLKSDRLMDLDLNEAQRILRDNIARFAEQELNTDILARDRAHEFSRDAWRKCGEMRLQGLPVPQEQGGAGLDPLSCAIALEALGYGCRDGGLVFSICAHLLACVVPIWKHGSQAQRERYLPGLCDGSLIAVNAMTEADTGSDAFAMHTRAQREGEGFRIQGTKIFCSNGPVADLAVVYALTDPDKGFHGGVTAFVVERGTPGFSAGQRFEKLGLRTAPLSELAFDGVYVPDDAVLGAVGGAAPIFAQSMDWERALLGASHVGTMQRMTEQALEYARTRRQYGQPIGKFQAISHRIADMKVRLEASRALVYQAAWKLDRARDAALHASTAKLFVSESLQRTALDLVQILGGYGFIAEHDAERGLRDAIGSTIYSGTSEIQRNIIARWLGL